MRPKLAANCINSSLKSAIAALIVASASLAGAQTLTTLVSFNSTNGAYPSAGLTLGNDGNFYGTTVVGGTTNSRYTLGMGTVFKLATNGTLTTLVSFNSTNGPYPAAGLTLGNDGNFYGTTGAGGGGYGTVFKVTTNGTLTTLVGFNGTNGGDPEAALTLGTDGNFYGTTYQGGITNHTYTGGMGSVFKVTTNGALTTLVALNFTNGVYPHCALTQGSDGNFYGTTCYGGATNSTYPDGMGTVFKVTTNGALSTLVSFNSTNGAGPWAGLAQDNDGNFYGTTSLGGSGGYGTVFKMTTNGTLTTLVSFNSINGSGPQSLMLGSDANFYGTTSLGGSGGYGTVFKMTTNGTLTTLVSFNSINGSGPRSLMLGNDANFYGTTYGGGGSGYGTVFRLLLPPVITVQPQSQTNNAGATVTFTIGATSLNTLGYQWQKSGTSLFDGGNLSGTTNSTLTITGISDDDAASYSVIVSNANFSVTSSNATLTVIDPPIITVQPTNLLVLPGTNVVFGVSMTGSASYFRYQWKFNSANILNATNAICTIASVGTNQGGNYSVVVTNAAGSAVSSNATLTVVLLPKSQTNYAGSTATFTVTAFGPESLNYQWQKNGTNLVDAGNLSGATNSRLNIANVADSDAANYLVMVSNAAGSVTSSIVTLTVIDPPIITSQPMSRTNNAGSTATFIVTANGTTPAYQWFKGSLPISGAVLATLTLTNVQDADIAGYTVVLTNAAGSATSAPPATLTVIDPPFITTQPLSRTNNAGSTATFTLTASGTTPAYQWFKGSLPISGAVLPTLTLTNVQDADMAGYSVVLTNAAGSATSAPPATLTVIDPPIITAQPSSLVVLPGTNAAFGVSLTGSAPFFRYQWKLNGTNILNATSASYAIPSVGTNHAGNYSVVVTNAAGVAVSSNAALNVVLSPKSQTNYASSTATLTVTTFGPESLNWQWQKNGTNLVNGGNLSGATNSTLTIADVSDADAAIYSAVVSDATGSVTTSNAVLTINDSLLIAAQPQSQTVGLGSNVTFSATVYGAPPFVFQWYFNGTLVGSPATGTNISSYALTNVGTNQAGNYSVEVINGYGSLMSSNAVLTVKVFPPIIGLQPSSQSVMMGSSALFSVSVSGTVPFHYQWRFNSINLLDATNAAYAIQAVGATNTGNYSVVVTNLAGTVTSSNAFLTVIVPPTLALQLLAGYPALKLDGMLSSNFVVQYSTNLAGTNWMNLLSLTNLPASPYPFLDPAGDGEPARFYRAFMR